MKLNTIAVHAGDRKRPSKDQAPWVPVTTPIYTATSYFYEDAAELDQVLGMEKQARAPKPPSSALTSSSSASLEGLL